MRNFPARSGKIALFSVLTLLLALPVFSQVTLRRAMDFDNDGRADFAVFRPSDSTWYINKSGGGGNVAQQFGMPSQDFMTPGDFDNDGKADISVWRDSDGRWYCLNSSNGTLRTTQWGITGDEPVARDYDGDGITDLGIVRRSNGKMFWHLILSTGRKFRTKEFGLSTDFTAPGDYDGDLKFDLAYQRPGATPTSAAVFHVLPSLTGVETTQTWGQSSDLIVPGDYDGDGKTDYAVVREGATAAAQLRWLIKYSSGIPDADVLFGITGTDLNVQNQYDTDAKTDLAIWRDTDGTFHYLPSLGGAEVTFVWGVANDFPIASYDTH